jgi:sec-independent protein translocase protein TatA
VPGPLSFWELIIILMVLLLLFGAKRLPEMGRSLGRGMREFKDAVTGKDDEQAELTAPAVPAAKPAKPAEPAAQPKSDST